MRLLITLFLTVLMVVILIGFIMWENRSITDWNAAFDAAKKGNAIRLVIKDISTPHSEAFTVTMVDHGKEYPVGASSFYAQNPMSCSYDLSSILLQLRRAPSKDTKIVLTGFRNDPITYSSMKVEIVKEQ